MGSKPQFLQKVISLCRRRGFFFQALPSKHGKEEERYVLGPLGAELKRNLINEW
jgi:glycyl-tRNA synthetase (class II)